MCPLRDDRGNQLVELAIVHDPFRPWAISDRETQTETSTSMVCAISASWEARRYACESASPKG